MAKLRLFGVDINNVLPLITNSDDDSSFVVSNSDSVYNPIPLRFCLQNLSAGMRKCNTNPIPLSFLPPKKRWNSLNVSDSSVVYNPIPLRYLPPKKRWARNRRRNTRSIKRGSVAAAAEEPPIPPQLLQSRVNEPLVFLYQKKLKASDVKPHLNRLFVNKRDRFVAFLNDGENQILNDTGKGLENVTGIDARGRLYKLDLKIWKSLKKMVINSGWTKVVQDNDAQVGDYVQIWGHREMQDKLCFAFHFIKSRKPNSDPSSSSNDNKSGSSSSKI